jgi:hypothetical protein
MLYIFIRALYVAGSINAGLLRLKFNFYVGITIETYFQTCRRTCFCILRCLSLLDLWLHIIYPEHISSKSVEETPLLLADTATTADGQNTAGNNTERVT